MRAGVIDIGSRSMKLIIGENSKDNDITILESLKNITPIANDTFLKDRISQGTINQTVSILEKYKKALKDYEVSEYKVIATTAVREARNRDIFVDTVLRKTGLAIETLTAGDIVYYIDAYLSYQLKDSYPIHNKNLLIFELGSGSLDLSLLEQGFTRLNQGLPLGTLRLKQLMGRLNGSLEETFEAVTEYISNEFASLERSMPKIKIDDIILIDENYAGYLQNILPQGKRQSRFFQLGIQDSQEILARLADKNPEEISRAYKIPADVCDTIIAYAITLNIFFTLTENKQIYILETSLAEAILAHMLLELELSKKYNKTNQLISVAKSLCQRYNVDLNHAQYVANLSDTLFDALKEQLGLKKDTLLYLLLASYMHDIGMFIHNRGHHKHSEYIINSQNLFRLNNEEVKMIAAIARYHRKATPNQTHLNYNSLPPDKQIVVQKLSAILRIANALDRSHKQKIKKLDVKINQNQDVALVATIKGNFVLEQEDFLDKKTLFEEITGNKISITVKS